MAPGATNATILTKPRVFTALKEKLRVPPRKCFRTGGGELIIKGLDGKIRSKDTIAPGNDPRSIKDKEH
jgi:hypothetical protein